LDPISLDADSILFGAALRCAEEYGPRTRQLRIASCILMDAAVHLRGKTCSAIFKLYREQYWDSVIVDENIPIGRNSSAVELLQFWQ
jgi:hypothetical protein